MSDFNSSLPIRTETAGDVAAKIVGASGDIITSQTSGAQKALDIGINVAGVQVDPRATRALTSADVVTANQGTANTAANGWTVKPTDGTNSQSFTAAGEAKASITQPLPAGTNLIGAVNLDLAGTPVSSTNPIPVSISGAPAGTTVNNYNTVADVAANASSNHIYTVTASKTFQGKKIHATSRAAMKVEVQTSPDGSTYSTVFVAFSSAAAPNIDIDMDELVFLTSGAGSTIKVIRTNLDKAPSDVYSTISGVEV